MEIAFEGEKWYARRELAYYFSFAQFPNLISKQPLFKKINKNSFYEIFTAEDLLKNNDRIDEKVE